MNTEKERKEVLLMTNKGNVLSFPIPVKFYYIDDHGMLHLIESDEDGNLISK